MRISARTKYGLLVPDHFAVLPSRTSRILVLQLDPRFSTSLYVKTAVILLVVMLSAAVAFYGTKSFMV